VTISKPDFVNNLYCYANASAKDELNVTEKVELFSVELFSNAPVPESDLNNLYCYANISVKTEFNGAARYASVKDKLNAADRKTLAKDEFNVADRKETRKEKKERAKQEFVGRRHQWFALDTAVTGLGALGVYRKFVWKNKV